MADLDTWLKASGLTHEQFAKMIGVSQAAVSLYRTGQRLPRRPILRAIATATGGAVMPNDFVPDEPAPTPSPDAGGAAPDGGAA